MLDIIYIITIAFLIILSILDIFTYRRKKGFIPAILTTMFIIISFLLAGVTGLIVGIFASLIALALIDLDLFHGVADLKVFIACGITLPSFMMVACFGLGTTLIAFIYKYIITKKFKKMKEIPFIPAILLAYLLILGVILLW